MHSKAALLLMAHVHVGRLMQRHLLSLMPDELSALWEGTGLCSRCVMARHTCIRSAGAETCTFLQGAVCGTTGGGKRPCFGTRSP